MSGLNQTSICHLQIHLGDESRHANTDIPRDESRHAPSLIGVGGGEVSGSGSMVGPKDGNSAFSRSDVK